MDLYNARRGREYSKYHGYAYDGIWVIALALDNVVQQSRGRFDLRDFRSDKIQGILNDTNFKGVTVSTTIMVLFFPVFLSLVSFFSFVFHLLSKDKDRTLDFADMMAQAPRLALSWIYLLQCFLVSCAFHRNFTVAGFIRH